MMQGTEAFFRVFVESESADISNITLSSLQVEQYWNDDNLGDLVRRDVSFNGVKEVWNYLGMSKVRFSDVYSTEDVQVLSDWGLLEKNELWFGIFLSRLVFVVPEDGISDTIKIRATVEITYSSFSSSVIRRRLVDTTSVQPKRENKDRPFIAEQSFRIRRIVPDIEEYVGTDFDSVRIIIAFMF